jgi:hypothetical protein
VQDVEDLAQFLDQRLAAYGCKLNVVVNYDNFAPLRATAPDTAPTRPER